MWLKVGLAFSKLHEEQRMESVLWFRNRLAGFGHSEVLQFSKGLSHHQCEEK